jgi:hypothetical protein
MMRLVKAAAALCLAAAALASAGCFYTRTTVNLREFAERGVTVRAVDRKVPEIEPYGRVRATQRTWLAGSCETAARGALEKLLGNAHKMGANRVGTLRFRARWRSVREPVCRHNLNWAWLIVPAFLPVPTSVTVSGEAFYDASRETAAD